MLPDSCFSNYKDTCSRGKYCESHNGPVPYFGIYETKIEMTILQLLNPDCVCPEITCLYPFDDCLNNAFLSIGSYDEVFGECASDGIYGFHYEFLRYQLFVVQLLTWKARYLRIVRLLATRMYMTTSTGDWVGIF